MRPFISVIIKPTLECNIDCRHCYHTPAERTSDRMTIELLDRLFGMLSKEYESVWFIWHGGEPTLLPYGFYKEALDIQDRYFGKNSHRVGNTIQTNGTLLDKRFINLCKEKKVNIGISFEGKFNDVLREKTLSVKENLEYLSRKERVYSVSSTISSETASKQKEI